jgi:hypothetical protein
MDRAREKQKARADATLEKAAELLNNNRFRSHEASGNGKEENQ